MTSQTPKRVVLGSLDVNVHTPAKRAVSPSSSPLKPTTTTTTTAAAAARPPISNQAVQKPMVYQTPQRGGGQRTRQTGLSSGSKRGHEEGEDADAEGQSIKRLRRVSEADRICFVELRSESDRGEEQHMESFDRSMWSVGTMFRRSSHDGIRLLSSSPRAALLSSPSTQGALNDESLEINVTQDTIITEPDVPVVEPMAPPQPLPPPMESSIAPAAASQEQLRERAQALRLRLSLASYKVRTNQTEIPLSRLQVRRTSPKLQSGSFPRLPPYSSYLSRQIRESMVPHIKIHQPSSKSRNSPDPDQHPPSSPPTFHAASRVIEVGQESNPSQELQQNDVENQLLPTSAPLGENESMLDPRLRTPMRGTEYPEKLTGSPI
ncbi:hypothetical protein F5884DRAFT_747138 [Xylogone sp. PMI_703]|nr:hypothetical protein F5884DRAFT_747138 [Xylogone sp. PMI_703]